MADTTLESNDKLADEVAADGTKTTKVTKVDSGGASTTYTSTSDALAEVAATIKDKGYLNDTHYRVYFDHDENNGLTKLGYEETKQ